MTHARRGIAALWFACLFCLALPAVAGADVRIIVKHAPDVTRAERGAIRADAGVAFAGALAVPGAEVVTVPARRRSAALRALNADAGVEYAEPVSTFRALTQSQPDDEYFYAEWWLENDGGWVRTQNGVPGADMSVLGAWDTSRGAGQTVAVVDTGVDDAQSDLRGRIAPGGRSFVAGAATSDDDEGHGTSVAGVIAANADNGEGIAGVAPAATVLPLKALDAGGSGDSTAIGDAFDYAGAIGMRVVNASIGSPDYSQYVRDAIARHPNTLYVVAAGNDGGDNDAHKNSDPQYPCNFPEPNVLCVGATDNRDEKTFESNFGVVSVDLSAPGWNIWAPTLQAPSGPAYTMRSGTSMSAAMVSGEAALVLGAHPNLGATSVKRLILMSADPIDALTGLSVTGGRGDALAAVTAALLPDTDGDGSFDMVDNCASIANAGQADADGDGIGDACDPTPRGPDQDGDGRGALDDLCPTVPAATPDGCPLKTSLPAPPGSPPATPPVTKPTALKVLALTVKLQPATCRRGVTCRRAAKVSVRLSRTAKLALRVERKVRTHGRSRWSRVYVRSLNVTPAGRVVTVRARGGRPLVKGSYRVIATPSGVKATIRPFRVP